MRGSQRVEEGLGAGGLVEVLPDGVVVHGGSQRHEHVPDGVGEGDDAVALEEEHAQAVDEAAVRQLVKTVGVALQKQTSEHNQGGGPGPEYVTSLSNFNDSF